MYSGCLPSSDAPTPVAPRNGWEFIDGFSMYSTALPKSRWFDHRGIAGDLHTHSHCLVAMGMVLTAGPWVKLPKNGPPNEGT